MKKLTILLCMILGLLFAACGSKSVTDHAVQQESGTEQSSSVQTEDMDNEDMTQTSAQSDQEAALRQYADTVPIVYMTEEISSKSLVNLYRSLDEKMKGNHTAVKISAGELPSGNNLEPELFRELVQVVEGTIVTCSTRDDLQPAENSKLSEIAKVTVLDEDGSQTIPVEDGLHLKENYVGNHFSEYDGLLVISYFQGHAAAGFDGAVKNVSVGISSAEGKCLIYSAGSSDTDPRGANQDTFLESMAEAGKSVTDAMNGNVLYMNIMNQRSIDGGFDDTASERDGREIGVLASADPVALDQACVDFVYMEDGNETFVNWMEKLNGEYALEYAEKIGLGSSAYTLVSID